MRYVFAIFIPPVGVLMCHRPVHFVINLIVWLLAIPLVLVMGLGILLWLFCVIHALTVCRVSSMDKRLDRLVAAIATRPTDASPATSPQS
ncbi:MAG: hypothetical protein JWM57_82 [Phycisphaerales bacterium]|nr:hypothetical protein [Phycisphaerales bacterium]